MRTIGFYMGERVQELGQPGVGDLLTIVNDGLADEEDGTVEEYGGHLARVGDRLLLTDSDGCHHAMKALIWTTGTSTTAVMVAHLVVAKHRLYREQAPS